MYLKDLEVAAISDAAGRYGRVIASCRREGRPPPGIYYLFAQRPQAAKALGDYMQEVMRGESELSPGHRELIAAWTSARNDCHF